MDVWQTLSTGAVGFCAGLILIGLIGFPRSPIARPLLGVAALSALWAAGELITWHSHDLSTEQIGNVVLYSGSIFLPPVWGLLAMRWGANHGAPLPRGVHRLWRLWLAWNCGMWLVMLTNPWHHRFLIEIVGDRNVLLPLWWVLAVPNYLFVLGTAGVHLWVARRVATRTVRGEAAFMIGAGLIVVVANCFYVLWLESPPVDGTLLVLAASGVVLFSGLRLEEERRRFQEGLAREVTARTSQLDGTNRDLRAANRRLRRLQEELLQAERLGAEEYLAGSIAHSINNPLTALKGRVEMALQAANGDDPVLQRISDLTRRIQSVVEGTLGLVRRRSLNLSVASPAAMLEDVREALAERAAARSVAIEVKTSSDVSDVVVDRSLLVAALVGIAENGIDAMAKTGGHLWLQAEEVEAIGVPGLAFHIADSGPGVPLELRSKVVEPFFTTKGGGTGLGLAIARGVIQGHAGRLVIDDRPGGGALVTVEIPLQPPGGTVPDPGAA